MRGVWIGIAVLVAVVVLVMITRVAVPSFRTWRRRRHESQWWKARSEARWEECVRTQHGVTKVLIRQVARLGHRIEVQPDTETQVGDDVREYDPEWDAKVRALRYEAKLRADQLNGPRT